jgi:hypothetical protein
MLMVMEFQPKFVLSPPEDSWSDLQLIHMLDNKKSIIVFSKPMQPIFMKMSEQLY